MRRPGYAFTLIELLVVISIIALLISILLPALKSARETSRRTVCMSQERSIGIAMSMYGNLSKDYIPWTGWYSIASFIVNDVNFYSGLGLIYKYDLLSSKKTMICPDEPSKLDSSGWIFTSPSYYGSYGYMANIAHPQHTMGAKWTSADANFRQFKRFAESPINAALVVDIDGWNDGFFRNSLHSKGANVLLVGGHVKPIPRDNYENATTTAWEWNLFNNGRAGGFMGTSY